MSSQCIVIGFPGIYGDLSGGIPLTGSAPETASLCVIAAVALVLYDQLCTISREVQFIWGRKFSGVGLLFYTNRWANVVWAALQVASGFPLDDHITCLSLNYVLILCVITLGVARLAFATIRVYAITGGNRVLAFVVGTLASLAPCVDVFCFYLIIISQDPSATFFKNRHGAINSTSVQTGLPIAARACLMIAEFIAMCITWRHTKNIKFRNHQGEVRFSLVDALRIDGTASFLVLLLLNILEFLTIFTSAVVYPVFSTPLSAIVISHFLLDVRQADSLSFDDTTAYQRSILTTQTQDQTATLQFNRPHSTFVGEMGGSLDSTDFSEDVMEALNEDDEHAEESGSLMASGDHELTLQLPMSAADIE